MNFFKRLIYSWSGFGSFFSGVFQVGQKGAIWIDTAKPKKIYDEIPQVKTVLNKLSDMFANAEVLIEKKVKDGFEVVSQHSVYGILHQPNILQSQNDYYKDLCLKFFVYGNNFSYYNAPTRFGVASRWNISPAYIKPFLTGKLFDQTEIAEIVSKFIYEDGERSRKVYEPREMLWLAEPDLDNPLKGTSRLVSLKYPISNIEGAYSYRNTIINNKGALGFLVNKTQDMGGHKPMNPKIKEELEKQYLQDYGHNAGQTPIKLVEGDVNYVPTTYPTKDMLLFEEIEHGLNIIAQTFGVSTNIFKTDTTYENLRSGIVQTYQDTVFAFADFVAQRETKMLQSLGALKETERIRFSYDHIEILQENKLQSAQTLERLVSAVNNALQNGIIDGEQAQNAISNLINRMS